MKVDLVCAGLKAPPSCLRTFFSPPILALLSYVALLLPGTCPAQVNYVARFTLEKESFILGEPIFCDFTVENTGTRTLAFSYRFPSRVLNRELELEPRFVVTGERAGRVRDPAPKPCGGAKGSVVYGSVTLPPGQTHTERWLLNQWAHVSSPDRYRVRVERRLPLFDLDTPARGAVRRPAAYAMAINELSFEVLPSKEAQLQAVFQPYLKTLDDGTGSDFAEAALVATTVPQPFLVDKLTAMANTPARGQRWDRKQALEGLARLGTRSAWEAIATIAGGKALEGHAPPPKSRSSAEDSLRAYAILLLAEKADSAFLPPLLELVSTAPEELRGNALRALGFFHDPRANQVLFEKLHSGSIADRVSAILGLRNLESKDAIPALLAMLNDPEGRVRQVADFALHSLTGINFKLPPNASRQEGARIAEQWHVWWRERGANFVLLRQPACHDW